MVGFNQLRFMMGYLATPRHQIGFCHSTSYSNLLSAPKKLHLTHRTKEFVQAQQELLEAGTPSVEENAESLLKSIQEVVLYTCIDARAKNVLKSSRKKEPLLIPNLSDLTQQDVNFVMLQVTATVERAMSVLEKEGFMWNFQMTPCFAQVAVTPMQNRRDKKTSVWPRFLLGKNWLCQRLNFPCWNSILILPLPQLLEQATKSGREQGLETKYWEERRNVGLCFLDCISFFNWLELISDVCSCPG